MNNQQQQSLLQVETTHDETSIRQPQTRPSSRIVTPTSATTAVPTSSSTSQAVDLVSHALLDDLQRQYLQTREKIEAFSYYGRGKIDQLEHALQQQQHEYDVLQHEHESTVQTLQRVRTERNEARRDLSRLTRKTVSLQKRVQELELVAARAAASASCGTAWTEYLCAWDLPSAKGFHQEEDCDDEITADTDSTEL